MPNSGKLTRLAERARFALSLRSQESRSWAPFAPNVHNVRGDQGDARELLLGVANFTNFAVLARSESNGRRLA
jgi:hypothetical protein